MNGVKTKTVKVIFLQPVKRVVNEIFPHYVAAGTVEIDRLTPRSAMAIGKELRRISPQAIPIRTKVVVNDVKEHH